MSDLIVEVCEITDISDYPNSDRLDQATIKGWKVAVQKGTYKPGDKCIYFPVDCLLTKEVAEKFGVTPYLKGIRKDYPLYDHWAGRVGAVKIRGTTSFGFATPCENSDWEIGKDVANLYNVEKWAPPEIFRTEDAETPHASFTKYTDIQNFKNFPDMFIPGEPVVITEKIHGSNARIGAVIVGYTNDDPKQPELELMAGSHNMRRKITDSGVYCLPLKHDAKRNPDGIYKRTEHKYTSLRNRYSNLKNKHKFTFEGKEPQFEEGENHEKLNHIVYCTNGTSVVRTRC